MVEHGGEPHPSLRMVPCVIWRGTELVLMANRSMGEVGKVVMMGLVKLSMMGEHGGGQNPFLSILPL